MTNKHLCLCEIEHVSDECRTSDCAHHEIEAAFAWAKRHVAQPEPCLTEIEAKYKGEDFSELVTARCNEVRMWVGALVRHARKSVAEVGVAGAVGLS
jgi:hypothetical protein